MRPVAIVVPCYNEEQRLNPFAFRRFLVDSPRCRLIFVNDGSRDGTLELLHRLAGACDPGLVEVVDLPQNGGKAEAVRQGMLHAWQGGAELIGFWDADLATPLDAVEDFVRVFDRYEHIEIVVGSRMVLLGHAVERNAKRSFLGRCFAWAASFAIGIRLKDTQCGAKMFRRTPALAAVLDRRFLSRWIFDVEMLARWRQLQACGAAELRTCLYERPLDTWTEIAGSRLKATDFLKAPIELWNIYWDCRKAAAPSTEGISSQSSADDASTQRKAA